ncbi:MAG TPA: TonB-dependent receptor plug domain-containing protein [Opitutaceae bacterium]|nr:TonB-dependent receptor plug domain-containing protein [Opitutaceae bacterium]
MKYHRPGHRAPLIAAVLLAGLLPAAAQTTPPAAAGTTGDTSNDAIVLSAFEVTSKKDSAYVADKSVSTTGFAADLAKIPLAIDVVTARFLEDTGGVGFNGVANYQAAFTTDQGGMDNGTRNSAGIDPTVGAVTGGEPLRTRVRGQPINISQRNGLPMKFGFGTENVDRVEVARGPMAVFVGGSTLGGVMNLVTEKPSFTPSYRFSTKVDSNNSFDLRADLAGPIIKDKLAYRIIAQYGNDNTWRDFSNSRMVFIDPQVTWRPFRKLTTRLEFAHRDVTGNMISNSMQSTAAYQRDYDNPSQALLNLGNSTALHRAYTVAEYRARIGRAFANWRADRYAVDGVWHSLGEGESFTAGDWAGGNAANHFGANDPFATKYDLIESETDLIATDWLELRLLGRWADQHSLTDFFSNALRRYPDGSTPLLSATTTATKREEIPLNGKIEAVFTQRFLKIDHKLLLGYEAAYDQAWSVNPTFNFAKLGSVTGSPNVAGSPASLTAANVLNYFDPRVHTVPDYASILTWNDETLAPGVTAQSYSRIFPEAGYVAYSGSFWKDRITTFAGYRNSVIQQESWTEDRNRVHLTQFLNTRKTSTQSNTLGLVFAPVKGLNFYVSQNIGTDAVPAGSLINATGGYTSLVTAEERAANPVPDLEGRGREAGLKVELFDRTLIGRVGVFDLTRHNTIIIDNDRTANDPRNIGTAVDPNPTTQNLAQTARVQWNKAIDGNTSRGVEIGFVWMPVPNYMVSFEASHLWTNQITVSKPLAGTPATASSMIDYSILNGRPLDNTPDDTLRVWQKYSFTDGPLKRSWIGFGVRAQTSLMPLASNSAWGTVVPGWTVFDAALGYETRVLGRSVALQLNVENLANKLYSAGGRTWSPPRTLTFSATTRF